jgi:hypothetical protein
MNAPHRRHPEPDRDPRPPAGVVFADGTAAGWWCWEVFADDGQLLAGHAGYGSQALAAAGLRSYLTHREYGPTGFHPERS